MEEYDKKTSRQKYAKHDEYINFRQGIYARSLATVMF